MNNSPDPKTFVDANVAALTPAKISLRVEEMYDKAQEASDEGIFVSYVPRAEVLVAAEAIAARVAAGEVLPLAGTVFTVKDNLDVRGLVTSCNCPGFGDVPEQSAPAIVAAQAAGAVLIAKTTMDQFATGLNGTRTLGTICRNAVDPEYIPGGSSSGSGVAVARGLCDFSFGSDTGGSGRVPAAMNGIVGLKPSLGLVSSRGMIYCNRSFDCIPIFAKKLEDAFYVLEQICGFDPEDPYSCPDAEHIELDKSGAHGKSLAVIAEEDLNFFGDDQARVAYKRNIARLTEMGYNLTAIDFASFREAGDMVFSGALVAERLVDYAEFIESNSDVVVEPVRKAILAGRDYSADDLYKTLHRLQALKREVRTILAPHDAFVIPTVTRMFTIAEMLENPMENNTIMGTYTYFANPLDLCAVSVPGETRADGLPSSLSFVAPKGQDGVIRSIANDFELS